MEWDKLHAPSVDEHLNEINYSEHSIGMRKTKYGKFAVEANDKFSDLLATENLWFTKNISRVQLLMTASCNLECAYCYSQHRKDFGKWTPELMWKVVEFLGNSKNVNTCLTLVGGEPLLEKKVILDFLNKYSQEMINANCTLATTTNGTLLTPEFIDIYFSYPFTTLEISCDTFDSGLDKRGLKKQLDHIHDMIEYISKNYEDAIEHRVSIAAVISESQIDTLGEFTNELVDVYNIRSFALLPLFASAELGLVSWTDENLNKFKNIALGLQDKNVEIGFLEGTGRKGTTNCLIGNNKTIVVDASGDFGGCYFCLNRKDELPNLVLGNMFENKFYHERMSTFINLVAETTANEEQCKDCNLGGGLCHQCFAGNFLATGKIVYPTDMCQRLVKIFLEINKHSQQKKVNQKFNEIHLNLMTRSDIDHQVVKMLSLLLFYDIFGIQIEDNTIVDEHIDNINVNVIISNYDAFLHGKTFEYSENIVDFIRSLQLQTEYSDSTLYDIVNLRSKIEGSSFNLPNDSSMETVSMLLTILHILVLNRYKSDKLTWNQTRST